MPGPEFTLPKELSPAMLRAFVYAYDLRGVRQYLNTLPSLTVASALVALTPEEIVRVIARLPARRQIAIYNALPTLTRMAIEEADLDWVACGLPIAGNRPAPRLAS